MPREDVEPEEVLVRIIRNTPSEARKRVYEGIIKRLEAVPQSVEELWSNTGERHLSNQDFQKVRVDLLEAAGWDPGGWLVMEWSRLPASLQADLRKGFPVFQGLIREESQKTVARVKEAMKEISWVRQ